MFPLVLQKSCNQKLLAFKARFRGLHLLLPDSQAGKTALGLRTFTLVGRISILSSFSSCKFPTQGFVLVLTEYYIRKKKNPVEPVC